MMNTFWNELPKPFFILAPMEAVTDVVFRHVVAKAGRPDIFFTEFTNTASYCSPRGAHSTRGRLAFTEDEHPMVAQIWGKNPDHFRQMAFGLKEMGYMGIDINMGCPDKSVVHGGSGSGLIRTPELAAEIIAATKEAGLPVSVKTRLGDVKVEEWKDWLTFILKQDVVNLTIHLRTRKEMSKVDAHFELIPEIKALRDEIAPNTLLTINGDIRDRAHGMELYEKYGVDGIMIGRGIFQNPFAFADLGPEDATDPEPKTTSAARVDTAAEAPSATRSEAVFLGQRSVDLLGLLNYQLDLFDKYNEELEPRKFDPLKRYFKIYVRDFAGASELREKLMHTKTTDEVRQLLNAFPRP
jgi:tRNA-dihydrouridine synthase